MLLADPPDFGGSPFWSRMNAHLSLRNKLSCHVGLGALANKVRSDQCQHLQCIGAVISKVVDLAVLLDSTGQIDDAAIDIKYALKALDRHRTVLHETETKPVSWIFPTGGMRLGNGDTAISVKEAGAICKTEPARKFMIFFLIMTPDQDRRTLDVWN